MLKLLCGKNDTNGKIVGEIIVVRNEKHTFSEDEKDTFNLILIPSLTVEDYENFIHSNRPEIKKVWNNLKVGWVDVSPKDSCVWEDNGKWKLLVDEHARRACIAPLFPSDLDVLKDKETPKATAILILDRLSFPFTEDSKNQVEITIG